MRERERERERERKKEKKKERERERERERESERNIAIRTANGQNNRTVIHNFVIQLKPEKLT